MLIPHIMSGQTVGVLGLGESGLAAVAALREAGVVVYAYDDKNTVAPIKDCTVLPWQEWPWESLDALVISPGIPHLYPAPHSAAARAKTLKIAIISEVELALRAAPKAKLVIITGTNGKSTTTALIGHCLTNAGHPVAVGGNIGLPASSLTDPGLGGTIVLELSSYQLETTPSLAPEITVVLNITPDHLDRHAGMNGYVAAKTLALTALKAGGTAILGASDKFVQQLAKNNEKLGIRTLIAKPELAHKEQQQCLALIGDHNAENAAAAKLVLRSLGLSDSAISNSMASFIGLPHRLQTVVTFGDITFVNDSKATNGSAAAKAIAAFKNIYWVAGGLAKCDGLAPVIPHLNNVKKAYLIGTAAQQFSRTLHGHCATSIYGNLNSATRAAFRDAKDSSDGATILLAPAAASFDQFENFGDRGNLFCQVARDLCSNQGGAIA